MSEEYISKEAAVRHIKENQCKKCSDIGLCGNCAVLIAVKLFESLPPADVKPVVSGEWLIVDESYWRGTQSQDKQINRVSLKCSNCGHRITQKDFRGIRNFCPNCGADMRPRGGQKHE